MKRSLLGAFGLLILTAQLHAMTVYLNVYAANCQTNGGAEIAQVSGGTPPYTYAWSNGGTEDYVGDLPPGLYSLTVTDALSEQATVNFEIAELTGLSELFPNFVGLAGLEPCEGSCDGGFRLHLPRVMGGYAFNTTPPMTYTLLGSVAVQEMETFFHYEFLGACSGQTVEITASIPGCSVYEDATFTIETSATISMTPLEITGSCTGADDGTITAQVLIIGSQYAGPWDVHVVDDQQQAMVTSYTIGGGADILQFTGLHPGDWTMVLHTPEPMIEFSMQPACITTFPFTVPDLGNACGTITGTVHFETDVDCTQETGEVGMPYQMMRFTPGPMYAITDQNGHYEAALPFTNYDLEQLNTDAVQLCPATAPIPFSVTGLQPDVVIDIADSVVTPFNVRVGIVASQARPGFTFNYYVHVVNLSGHPGNDISASLNYDPLFTFVSASSGLTVNTPGAAQWDLPTLLPFEHRILVLQLQVPADPGLIGTSHTAQANVTSSTFDSDLTDNAYTRVHLVQGAYDPNDKQAFTSSGFSESLYFIDQDQYIDYVVRFQNTGTDTAFTVSITDTISALLDMNSLEILGSSHPFTPMVRGGNVLEFTFNSILLPDSGTNEAESHGHVAFRMRPVAGLGVGESIHNTADIYFDFNPPVRTNTATLVAEISTGISATVIPTLTVSPIPVMDVLTVRASEQRIRSMEIMALDGRVLGTYGSDPTIDVSRFIAGVYVLRAFTSEGAVLQTRFVKR